MYNRKSPFFTRITFALLMALPAFGWAKTKVVLIAGRDSHGTNAHNWGDGVDLLSDALTKESGIPIETAIHKGGWPKDASIFDGAATVVILSDGGGRHPINRALKEFDALAEKARALTVADGVSDGAEMGPTANPRRVTAMETLTPSLPLHL